MLFFNSNIDHNLELRLKLISTPCEKRFEIFERQYIQEFLKEMTAKDVVNLYELFPPNDAYKFFISGFIIDRLGSILTSEIDYEDIISYFQGAKKDSVRNLLSTHLIQRQEPNNTSDADEGYCSDRGFRI